MTTNDKPLTRNYDSDKEKSEIDSDIRVLKIRQRLAAHSGGRNCIFTIAVVTLQGFVLGKLDLLTVSLGKLKFTSVTDFSLSKLPRESFIVWGSKTAREQKNVLWISLDNYPKAEKGKNQIPE